MKLMKGQGSVVQPPKSTRRKEGMSGEGSGAVAVSDAHITRAVHGLLNKSSDFSAITLKQVREQLEEELGTNLKDRKTAIKLAICSFDTCAHEEETGCDLSATGQQKEHPDAGSGQKRKRSSSGLNKKMHLSTALAAVVGKTEMGRTDVVKGLWGYIRERNLQNPKNRQEIRCDDKLTKVFRRKTVTMFSMNKYLGEHLSSLEDWKDPERKDDDGLEDEEAKRVKEEDSGEEEDNAGRKQKRKRATRKAANTSGIWKRYKLSDQLGAIVGENISNRQQIIRKLWEHIREHNLQDPQDRRFILANEQLLRLFGEKRFAGFKMAKLIGSHLSDLDEVAV